MILQNLGLLLHNCSKTKSLLNGRSIQASLIKQGSQSDVFLSNHLLNMYAKCCKITEAHQVFDEMVERNLVSWSAMISGCDQSGEHSMALNLFSQMQLEPNEFIYASVISACSSLLALIQGQQVHAQTLKSGFDSVSFVSNSLMSMYMNCRLCNDACSIFFEKSEVTSVVSYNAMIMGFAENSQPHRGLKVFDLMVERGVLPDLFSFVGVFGICSDTKDFKRGIQLHSRAIKLGFDVTAFVGNVILTMYYKCNLIEEAEKIFTSIEEKDVTSWNTIISACSHCGDYAKSVIFFREMMGEDSVDVRIDDFTLASALTACAGLASIRIGDEIHAHIIRRDRDLDVGVGNALVNMYAKCGSIGCASTVFNRMMQHNLVSWNTMIAAFGNHGLGRRAIEMFEHMKQIGVKPDSVTFIGLLIACNHAGLVDEGRAYFNSMKDVYGVVPEIEHFSCLVDLLGRAGRLEEAKKYLEKFPVYGNDLVVLGSLLSACRLRGDVVVAEWVSRRLLELQPVTSSPFVLLSNLYASDGKWAGVAETRKLLKDSGVKKQPGHSLIEVNGIIKKFTAGDFLHSSMKEMKHILRSLTWVISSLLLYKFFTQKNNHFDWRLDNTFNIKDFCQISIINSGYKII